MSLGNRRAVPLAWRVLGKRMLLLAVAGMCVALPSAGQQSANEQAVWKLESAYWDYVKAVDLESYRKLWHQDFVGWPSSSSQPARKAQITDWITAFTEKGGSGFSGSRSSRLPVRPPRTSSSRTTG